MDDAVELWEVPAADEVYMLAGWRQWADAGSISSELPRYLVKHLAGREIGRIRPEGFYLFQLPGMQDLLRPHIKLADGQCAELTRPDNKIYYWQNEGKGLVILAGDEPHLNIEAYADAFFAAARQLRVRRIAALGGVYAPVPYDKRRNISCTYSLPAMRRELERYAVSFSDYEGGTTIGSYMLEQAERLGLEYLGFYAMVPYYDFAQLSSKLDSVGLDQDYMAWYDVMGRLNHMFGLGADLADLAKRSQLVAEAMSARLSELARQRPQAAIDDFMAEVNKSFTEQVFEPLGDVWERELRDLFEDEEQEGE